jgi:8-oxo-dGTP pyrophosphatase MutT (NUDIX family)
MKRRLHASLLGFLKTACTHASQLDREILLTPFVVQDLPVGWLRPSFADQLRRWPHVFAFSPAAVTLRPETPQARTEALNQVTRELEREGAIRGWRDEPVTVSHHYCAPELFRIERSASRHFGLVAYASHVNGLTLFSGELHVWIARRSPAKSVDPNRLDNLVGGRIAAGYTVEETVRKEAWEEAGIPEAMMQPVKCAGAVRVEYTVPEGLHREILFIHDLWLPADYTPANQDGEVAALYRMPVAEVVEAILAGEFTLDAGAVMVESLIRNGVMHPEDPEYLEMIRLLRP